MKRGYLSEYFEGVATKRLSAVEADVIRSHQHELNGVEGLREMLGEPDGKVYYDAKLLYLTDQDDDPIVEEAVFTWYDARQRARLERGVMRWEYRLYFPTTNVSLNAVEGDLLVIGKRRDGGLLVVIAENGSSIARQIEWLFGFSDLAHPGYSVKSELETEQDRIEFASRFILEAIGVVVETSEETYLEAMLDKFKGKFPTTRDFSSYARSTLKDVHPKDSPDLVLMAWMEREEILFRTLERHLIADRLSKGFAGEVDAGVDVDGFLSFSLSVQNRRKSRVGLALENHLEVIFDACGIRYKRTAITENKAKPDFLFPGQAEYHSPTFDAVNLTMLGVKSTCKDRWRQVLAEADRIDNKHLLTLETAISTAQTDEMAAKRLQLVLPRGLHETYTAAQQAWLMDLTAFTETVLQRQ
ncbi:restriction endonuclease [Pandoraea cepalis]|uniref:Restriction endonuclease n=1 Tax=Pandoraea cepalis TaxID=2508294 RepID=A0AAW7MIQ5_9BURK|nr:type II restriction endonuclease [Pandoraea cepalis]MDN4572658.1 restriction endonuclease [Pandoraea cepalis]MDN4577073.1 restriction endonuclease [Pandoraea cepalis]